MRRNFVLIILLQLVVSCAPFSQVKQKNDLLAYVPKTNDQSLLSRFQPVFIVEDQSKPYNRIGTARVQLLENSREWVYVDPAEATLYAEEREVTTETGTYINLIYRVHFSKTPFGLFPFQLGMGHNVGLIVIVTVNRLDQPILYTTVHTCGCYLAFIPTTYLPKNYYPARWPEISQVVYSEMLPAILDPAIKGKYNSRLAILIRSASHRIKEIWLTNLNRLNEYATSTIRMQPLESLEKLPLPATDQHSSFYETAGKRVGYVKRSQKPFERILMSWWAFDLRVGEDKKLGMSRTDPPIFYTSLKPWAREESDMRDFPAFLNYWGWKF